MNKDELFYQLALKLVPTIGCVQARILIEKFGDAKAIFHSDRMELEQTEGIGGVRAENICGFKDFTRVEAEMNFIEKYKIRPLFLTDRDYPQRLLHCHDSPPLLFYKGEADLNATSIISVVGTRNSTDYGRQVTEKLLSDLAGMNILIVSGLAYGIDALAHRTALKHGLKTVGVLGHGMEFIYPPQHKGLAMDMLGNEGGLLTEFCSTIRPVKHNFPARNRIVAGMSDATIIVETDMKGGSMITAELANNYKKDVFAYPGKITDVKSSGCNELIKSNKAILLTDGKQLLNYLGWEEHYEAPGGKYREAELPATLNENEQKLAAILQEKEKVHIDELNLKSNLSTSAVAAAILNMELLGIIRSLPGKRYKLV